MAVTKSGVARVGVAAAVVAAATVLTCGEPLYPQESQWQILFTLPSEYTYAYAMYGSYVVAGTSEGEAAIIHYDVNEMETLFVSPAPATFEDIGEFPGPGEIIAVGNKETAAGIEPYAVVYDDGKAKELPLPALPGRTVSGIINQNFGAGMWLLVSDHEPKFYGKHAGIPVFCGDGAVKAFEWLGPVTAACPDSSGAFFALEYAGDNPDETELGPGYTDQGHLYITYDFGAAWVTELFPASIEGRPVHAAEILDAHWSILFIKVIFKDGATGIVRRSGAPGAGVYDLLFLSYEGPWFHGLRAFSGPPAVSSDFWELSEGIGVGNRTTVVHDNGKWEVEVMPFPVDFVDVCSLLDYGFLALGRDNQFRGWAVYAHP